MHVKNFKIKSCLVCVIWLLSIAGTVSAAPELVRVDGGTFNMGDTSGGNSQEQIKQVTVNSFCIGKYEVTFAEYGDFCKEAGKTPPKALYQGRKERPVIGVTWQEAVQYCNWLSMKEELTPAYYIEGNKIKCDFTANGYRLPTEAEWEYAAKGGSKSKGYKYSGSNDMDEVAWYKNNSGNRMHAVGQKLPNELGLYDMSGNAWEWCWEGNDKEHDISYKYWRADFWAIRGGSINYFACSPAYRFKYPMNASITYIGFRIAKTI